MLDDFSCHPFAGAMLKHAKQIVKTWNILHNLNNELHLICKLKKVDTTDCVFHISRLVLLVDNL